MKEKNKRNMFLKIRVSEEEMAAIKKKQQNSGIPTDFVRTMLFRDVIIHIDKPLLKSICDLFSNIANNINQIAIRVNSTGNIYEEDIKQIQDEVSQILHIRLKLHGSIARVK